MKIRTVVLAIATVGLLITPTSTTLAQQTRERVVELMLEKERPLDVAEASTGGQRITFGDKFIATDDWMRSLKLSIRNTSPKRILYAEVTFFFPRPSGSKELPAVFTHFYGNRALLTRPPNVDEQTVGIAPGETVEIGFSEQKYLDIRKFFNEVRFPSVERVGLMLGRVIFEDDTAWYGGDMRRDPRDPTSWVSVRPSDSKPH
jgi:hypothetical protein